MAALPAFRIPDADHRQHHHPLGQSEQVALGRYREGVGSILDLLTAQRSLAQARAQQVNARLSWHIALARLARDIGQLGAHGENPLVPASTQTR